MFGMQPPGGATTPTLNNQRTSLTAGQGSPGISPGTPGLSPNPLAQNQQMQMLVKLLKQGGGNQYG